MVKEDDNGKQVIALHIMLSDTLDASTAFLFLIAMALNLPKATIHI